MFDGVWTGRNLGILANIWLPALLLLLSIGTMIWFLIEVKNKRLRVRTMSLWFILNVLFTISITYILVISILQFFRVTWAINFFDILAHYIFGFTLSGGQEWIFVMILTFIAYLLVKTLRTSIKVSKMNTKIEELNREVAVLSGKVNKSASFNEKLVAVHHKTVKDAKQELKKKLKIAKAKVKTNAQIKAITENEEKAKKKKQ